MTDFKVTTPDNGEARTVFYRGQSSHSLYCGVDDRDGHHQGYMVLVGRGVMEGYDGEVISTLPDDDIFEIPRGSTITIKV